MLGFVEVCSSPLLLAMILELSDTGGVGITPMVVVIAAAAAPEPRLVSRG
jgi:hypothetical protein